MFQGSQCTPTVNIANFGISKVSNVDKMLIVAIRVLSTIGILETFQQITNFSTLGFLYLLRLPTPLLDKVMSCN